MKALANNQIKQFIMGGKAIFTVENELTGGRMTYKVSQPKHEEGETVPYFASVLNGSDNYTNYAYMGMVVEYGGKVGIKSTKGSKVGQEATSYKGFQWLCSALNNRSIPETVNVYHEGKCGKCGKKLTVPQSIEMGFGSTCAKALGI